VGSPGKDSVRGVGAGEDGSIYASGVLGGKAIMIDRQIPRISRSNNDYVVKVSPDGEPLWLVTMAGPGRSLGAELVSDERGVVVSSLVEGPVTIRRNRDIVGVIESPTGLPTSYLAAFDHAGNPRFVYMPSPEARNSGALGDVLSVSRNGKYVAQAIRFRGRISIDGTVLTTPSQKDSAAILLRLNGSRGQ
jgi:hypothetical protein